MPQVIATTVCRIDELPEGAKDRARAWYREGGFDHDWYDTVYEDFQRIAEILGIRLKTRTTRLVGGRTREDPCIWFSGFWSQGDGACWEGTYSHRKSAAADPSFAAPIYANLFDDEDGEGSSLIWSRPNTRRGD